MIDLDKAVTLIGWVGFLSAFIVVCALMFLLPDVVAPSREFAVRNRIANARDIVQKIGFS